MHAAPRNGSAVGAYRRKSLLTGEKPYINETSRSSLSVERKPASTLPYTIGRTIRNEIKTGTTDDGIQSTTININDATGVARITFSNGEKSISVTGRKYPRAARTAPAPAPAPDNGDSGYDAPDNGDSGYDTPDDGDSGYDTPDDGDSGYDN